MWSVWLVFCKCGFHSVCPLMDKDKRLVEASWCDGLAVRESGSCFDGQGHAQYIFNPIFCWWVGLFPTFSLAWGRGNDDLLQKDLCQHAMTLRTVVFIAPDSTAGHRRPMSLPETPGHSQASLAQSLVGTLLLSPGFWCAQGFVCALQESVSSVLWKSVFKSHWPSKSNSLGVLSPYAGSLG